ncbi:hypothetical protein A0H81_03994 [Grifola frondosa]|uniref:Uncharacterized protein n=1 Tax=Grifola frondosa TaxID=5627 RepID=A0A1C7MKG4_GRIFR|nr:hypothetical protein A0H81_03994 [Grifola frondosa]
MCRGGTWKREVVPDHKVSMVYISVLIGFLVYVSDIFTAVTMLTTRSWSNAIFNSCPQNQTNGCVYIPFSIGRWSSSAVSSSHSCCWHTRHTKKIIQSRDISYAFTNVMANKYILQVSCWTACTVSSKHTSLGSYDHFCFFNHIAASTKRMDDFAFFVFFTFKSWKRLLFADGPENDQRAWYDISKYFDGTLITSALTVSTAFTVLIFAISLLSLIVAGICYIPLLCHIQGNLKEYCCHKVDKRITEIIKRRNKQRLAKAAAIAKKEAAGDFSHLKNKKGELIAKPLPSRRFLTFPTLGGKNDYFFNDYKAPSEYDANYPPMPSYGFHQYTPSDDYGSTAHLPSAAAPFGHSDDHASISQTSGYGAYISEPYDTQQQQGYPQAPAAGGRPQEEWANAQYAQQQQHGYAQGSAAHDDWANNPYAPDYPPPQVFGQQGHDSYGYYPDQKHGGYQGNDYDAGPAHAM